MFQALKKKSKRIATTFAAGVLLFSQLAVVPAVSATDSNHISYWCSPNYDGGVKFEVGSGSGKLEANDTDTIDGIQASLSSNKKEVDVSATDSAKSVKLVVVKAGSEQSNNGPENLTYNTAPFENLTGPLNKEISHVIACYDFKDTTVQVIKKLDPANDSGKFNLAVKYTTVSNVGHNGTTGKVVVSDTQDVSISEAAGTNTSLNDYTTSIVCKDNGGQGNTIDSGSPTGGSSRGLVIEKDKIDPGDDIVCTITNTRKTAGLTVIKDVINDNGGTKTYADFTFTVAGQEYTFNATTSPDGSRTVNLPTGTNYTVIEPQANSGGYTTTYSTGCTGTIVSGQTPVCTITNNDQPGKLIVKKVVINNNGGTKEADDFSFSVNGGQTVAFEADGQNDFTVNAGTYSVLETTANGYTTTYDNCTNVVVPNGGTATCTITNDDAAAKLTVIKNVLNNNGGTKVAPDFTMYVTGTNVSDDEFPGNENGTTVSLNPGSYSVTEGSVSGYTGSYSAECAGTIALGEHKYCTITNDDNVPVLILIKQVLNLNGGTAKASDFLLTADGPTTLSGYGGATSGNTFLAGTYNLSESGGPSGYSASNWTCAGGSQSGSSITLGVGEIASCTITNYDNPTKITVVKEVINNNGGTAKASDFDLWVDSTQVLSGVTNNFDGNEWYFVKETNVPSGYKQTSLKCWDVTSQTPVAVTNPFYAKLGHSYKCKIVNDDIAPKLKVVKDSQPNSIQVFDFTIEGNNFYDTFKLNDNGTNWPVNNDKTFHLNKGSYTVTEDQTDGWYLDSIICWGTREDVDLQNGSVTVDLKLGDDVTCKFVNKKFGAVYGFKFDDVNGDGNFDKLNEAKLEGWTITIDQVYGNFEDSTVTGPDGHYGFTNLKPGLYKVCEELQAGWVQTAPGTPSGCEFVWVFASDSDDVNFGNFKLGVLTGVKFNDVNGNGVRDNGETTLKNWEIALTKKCVEDEQTECDDQTWTTKTDTNGAYSFKDLTVGTYIVCEVQQANWTQTAPNTKDGCKEFVVSTSGHEEVVDFGNKAKPQVLGESTTKELVKTGASTAQGLLAGLSILGVLGVLHLMTRRKNYSK